MKDAQLADPLNSIANLFRPAPEQLSSDLPSRPKDLGGGALPAAAAPIMSNRTGDQEPNCVCVWVPHRKPLANFLQMASNGQQRPTARAPRTDLKCCGSPLRRRLRTRASSKRLRTCSCPRRQLLPLLHRRRRAEDGGLRIRVGRFACIRTRPPSGDFAGGARRLLAAASTLLLLLLLLLLLPGGRGAEMRNLTQQGAAAALFSPPHA